VLSAEDISPRKKVCIYIYTHIQWLVVSYYRFRGGAAFCWTGVYHPHRLVRWCIILGRKILFESTCYKWNISCVKESTWGISWRYEIQMYVDIIPEPRTSMIGTLFVFIIHIENRQLKWNKRTRCSLSNKLWNSHNIYILYKYYWLVDCTMAKNPY